MRRFAIVVGLFFAAYAGLAVCVPEAVAQAAPAATEVAAARDDAPVPVPQPSEKALSYYRSGNILWVVNLLWGLLVPAVFLFTGFSATIRNWAQKLGRKWFFVIGIYFAIFSILTFVIDLPLSYYQGFVRQHAYGLSNQAIGKWWGDSLKGLALGIVMGFLFMWVPYLLLKKSPNRWWLYVSILAIPFICLMLLIGPIWVDPMFNDFGPMKDKGLETKIIDLADKAGIHGSRVFEVNKSVDTKMLNAYVAGFLNTKRIVLWDTTIARLSEGELLVVMAHEMGHYVLGHIWKLIILSSLFILAMLYLAHRTARSVLSRFKDRFGFDNLADVASLPLILLLMSVFGFVASPISNAFSRHIEHEADTFALEMTRDNHDAATAFVKLQMDNLSNPRPGALYKLWRATHPPLGERIDFANVYKPWQTGEPLRYEKYFGM